MSKTKLSRRLALLLAVLTLLSTMLVGCGKKQVVEPEVEPEEPEVDEVIVKPEPVEVPVDFAAAQEKWPNVYASIRIPAATRCTISGEMGYFIAQHPTDDGYYLYRDLDGKDAKSGTLYTEKTYNKTDFSDPVTVIYGHNMANRTMFGGLQSFAETLKFDGDDALFYIYQPGRQLTYRIFAGIPYDTSHVLYYHDFTDEKVFADFFAALAKAADDPNYTSGTYQNAFYSGDGCVNVDKDNLPVVGDKVVILATCKNGDSSHRYWILAKLVEDTAEPVVMTKEEAEKAGVTPDRIITQTTDTTTSKTDTSKKTNTAGKAN